MGVGGDWPYTGIGGAVECGGAVAPGDVADGLREREDALVPGVLQAMARQVRPLVEAVLAVAVPDPNYVVGESHVLPG